MKYRKKPVVIEAIQWDGNPASAQAIFKWAGIAAITYIFGDLTIHTLEGDMKAAPNDWVIRGVEGEFYPVKDDIFAATYEEVSD